MSGRNAHLPLKTGSMCSSAVSDCARPHRRTRQLLKECSQPPEGSQPLHFSSQYACGWAAQFRLLLHRNMLEYWRMPEYNTVRILFTCMFGLTLGSIYWRIGTQR